MERRAFIGLAAGASMLLLARPAFPAADAAGRIGKLVRSDAEWKKILTPAQYHVLREEGTEYPYSSPLLNEKRNGLYVCVACGLPLFHSRFKYDSHTGWPSFWDVLPGRVGTRIDRKLLVPRIAYHCARCGGHQGHLFDDGPKPTGLRYCNNGVALRFVPDRT